MLELHADLYALIDAFERHVAAWFIEIETSVSGQIREDVDTL